jgi:hypothetical protein
MSFSSLDYFAKHPLLGLIGTIASVVGVAFTVIVFFVSQRDRDIRYMVSASPTTIVRGGQSSDLRVHFKEKEVTSDVSSIQVEIWNNGKESIRGENILSPVTMKHPWTSAPCRCTHKTSWHRNRGRRRSPRS